MDNQTDKLSFRISTGLKNIIGRDLISDKFIAIFELVKNSYDAGAHLVTISFSGLTTNSTQITIMDDGSGMSYDDIIGKWLFVAYSAKKKENRQQNYREKIRRNLAGAKGVGRFSCDRLGSKLTLTTKTPKDKVANTLKIDWDKFEVDDSQEFMSIPVLHNTAYELPHRMHNGTVLTIMELRELWDRSTVLKLKKSLMKLINPDVDSNDDPFSINFYAPEMAQEDEKIRSNPRKKEGWEREIVNGLVINDIFEKMNIKTTNIKVDISKDGKTITTELSDRGEFIFKFSEKNNQFTLLKNISVSLFYLNRSAKVSFTRHMGGVEPVNYGSVFIYKNGFRINPYGDPGEDFYSIDKRKAQGYNRFLGTREIMGRISIQGDNEGFIETSSRAHGFINTVSVEMLGEFFLQKVLKVLERYVVNIISWGEPIKSDPEQKTIMPLETPEAIISEFADMSRRSDILKIDYNPALLSREYASMNSNSLVASIERLEKIATKTQNDSLANLAKSVKEKTTQVMSNNISLEKQNVEVGNALKKELVEKEARERQVFFLQGLADNSSKNLINGMHSIYTNSEVVRGYIKAIREILGVADFDKKDMLQSYLAEIAKANSKANKTAELAIKGNQKLKQTEQSSLSEYIRQYIDADIALKGLKYTVIDERRPFLCVFDPSSMGIIFDNIVSNSLKAKADELQITFYENKAFVFIQFKDNGIGLNPNIDSDKLFSYGLSANSIKQGFGIGLNQIRELAEEMGGEAHIMRNYMNGFGLEVSIKK